MPPRIPQFWGTFRVLSPQNWLARGQNHTLIQQRPGARCSHCFCHKNTPYSPTPRSLAPLLPTLYTVATEGDCFCGIRFPVITIFTPPPGAIVTPRRTVLSDRFSDKAKL